MKIMKFRKSHAWDSWADVLPAGFCICIWEGGRGGGGGEICREILCSNFCTVWFRFLLRPLTGWFMVIWLVLFDKPNGSTPQRRQSARLFLQSPELGPPLPLSYRSIRTGKARLWSGWGEGRNWKAVMGGGGINRAYWGYLMVYGGGEGLEQQVRPTHALLYSRQCMAWWIQSCYQIPIQLTDISDNTETENSSVI